MCMIDLAVVDIQNTKLFIGLDKEKQRQITIYSNEVNNISKKNTMILPVPFPSTVKFHNLSGYKDIFDDCSKCFSVSSATLGSTYGTSLGSSGKLKVFSVGSYRASLAMKLSDLDNVDRSLFSISLDMKKVLNKYYGNSFGFIICCLEDGDVKYHPFAYSHKITGKVFIPTRHYHVHSPDGNPYGFYGADGTMNTPSSLGDAKYGDWDHQIYLYNVSPNSNISQMEDDDYTFKWNGKNNIDVKRLDGFNLDFNCRNFSKVNITGKKINSDLILNA